MAGSPHPKPAAKKKARRRGRPGGNGDLEARGRFKALVIAMDAGRCIVHGDSGACEGALQAHHVVTQQQLRKAGRHDLLWDPRNGATVCEDDAHRRHTLAVERIPRRLLPARCERFAAEHGFEAVLSRYYPSGP